MIEFQWLKGKNFMSVGDQPITIDFNEFSNMLITGSNGVGKTSLIEMLVFVLYNKSFRKVNKPQLINSINDRDLLVEIGFKANGKNYHVKRGIKPNIFEIYEEGKLLEQRAKNTDYQKTLEQQILKIDYKTFIQVVILSTSNYTPFMQLPTGQRRETIEDLLDINIFTWMNRILKDRVRDTKSEIQDKSHQINNTEIKIDSLEKQIKLITQQNETNVEDIRKKARELKGNYETSTQDIKEINEALEKVIDQYNSTVQYMEKSNMAKDMYQRAQGKIERLEKEKDFFNHQACPTCHQEISDELRQDKVKSKDAKLKKLYSVIGQLEERLTYFKKIESELNDLKTEKKRLEDEKKKKKYERDTIKKEAERLKREYEEKSKKAEQSTADEEKEKQDLESTLKQLQDTHSELQDELQYLEVAARLLRDDGIKAEIIKKFLPMINQKILEYLDRFDFHVAFRLNEEFKEEILARYYDAFSYESFSAGERQRIDLALLFAWRDVARAKNSASTNLLILDEVLDSSFDSHAMHCLIEILDELAHNHTKVVVISHRSAEGFYDSFENHMHLHKNVQGFTEVSSS